MPASTPRFGPAPVRCAARWSQTMEIVARAFGATRPHMVAEALGPHCPDVPAAIQALRARCPQWFAAETDILRSQAGAAVAGSQAPVMICVRTVSAP